LAQGDSRLLWGESSDQYMGKYLVIMMTKTYPLLIILAFCLQGCSAQDDSPIVAALKTEQQSQKVVIGRKNYSDLEIISFENDSKPERKMIPLSDYKPFGGDDAAQLQHSSDGRIASCVANRCSIYDAHSGRTQAAFRSDHILTPLYWSPDNRFLLFVREVSGFRFPVRCSLEDERDVIVYEPASGQQTVVTTVCGGYPYSQLRWYTASMPS
jgi:hypothetical protein